MSYTLQNLTPRTGTLSSPFPDSVFQQPEQPCEDQRPQQSGALTEFPPLAGYEPNRIAEFCNDDYFSPNVKSSQLCAMLHIFEENEAVIRMIIKGRSPTMRHVSRTQRVALDSFFDRINLGPKKPNQYVDTKHQLADILTKGKFTRDEWNNLLYLFNISHFSSLCCAQNFSLTSSTRTMAKRMPEQEGDNRIVAKSKPTTMNLAVSVSTSSSTVNSPIASKSPGVLKAPCRTEWSSTGKPDARDRNHDAASSSQGWQKDAFLDVSSGKPVATEEDQEHLNFPEDSESTGKLIAPGDPGTPGNTGDSETEGNDEDWPHNLHISSNYVLHMEIVFSIVTKIWSQSDGSNEEPRCEHSCMVNICVCHS